MRAWLLVAIALAVLAVIGVGFWILRPGSQPIFVSYYRIVDEHSMIIGTEGGSCDYGRTLEGETRVTEVVETADSVTITVRNFTLWSGPCAGVGVPIELPVELDAPLGDRAVFDPYHAVPSDKQR